MTNPQVPVPSRSELFDMWYTQLQQAGERYGYAWAQFAEAVEEYRAALLAAANGSLDACPPRLPDSAGEYLATVRTITDLIAKGTANFAGLQHAPALVRERRLACRYPVQMDLEYRLLVRGEVIGAGQGRTVNTSSTGILFQSELALPLQTVVQLTVKWLESPRDAATVELHVAGRTVRRQDNATAVAIDRYEFRIWREGSPQGKPVGQ